MPQNKPFDRFVDEYEAWFLENPLEYASEVLAIRDWIPPGGRVLEVGVGSGRFSGPLKIAFGLDPSLPMIRLARRRGTRVFAAAGEALPVRDGALDGILLVTTLCFMDDPAADLGQARRALRAGGSLICAFIDADSPLGRQYRERQEGSRFYREARFYSIGEVRAFLEGAGFTIQAVRQTLIGPPEGLRAPAPPRPGAGEGAFVVVRAVKGKLKADPAIN